MLPISGPFYLGAISTRTSDSSTESCAFGPEIIAKQKTGKGTHTLSHHSLELSLITSSHIPLVRASHVPHLDRKAWKMKASGFPGRKKVGNGYIVMSLRQALRRVPNKYSLLSVGYHYIYTM